MRTTRLLYFSSVQEADLTILTQIPVIDFFLLLVLNTCLGAIGFFPSVLLTALNINCFGVTLGMALSLSGEIVGAIIGFYLYRYGFSKINSKWLKHSFWNFLQQSSTKQIFWAILLLRLIPFVPSGLVTAGAGATRIPGTLFIIASTIGKIPAVFLEVAIVYGVIHSVPLSYQFGLASGIVIMTGLIWNKNRRKIQV